MIFGMTFIDLLSNLQHYRKNSKDSSNCKGNQSFILMRFKESVSLNKRLKKRRSTEMKTRTQIKNRKSHIIWSLLLLSQMVFHATGEGTCSCSPLVYNWKLDFSLSCLSSNVAIGPSTGISESFCEIKALDHEISNDEIDDVPISVDSFTLIELSDNLLPIKVETASGLNLTDGDVLSFSSLTAVKSNVFSGGLQATLGGINSVSQRVELNWIVKYSNLCFLPPYKLNDSFGWMVYANDTPARTETCFPPSSQSIPTDWPSSLNPSHQPSTQIITQIPSHHPSFEPSGFPTTSIPSSDPAMHAKTTLPSYWPTENLTPPNPSPAPSKSAKTKDPSKEEWLSYSMSMYYFSMDFGMTEEDSEFFF